MLNLSISFFELFLSSVLTLATTDVKPSHQINALNSGSFTAKNL